MALGIFKKQYVLRKFASEGEGYVWSDQAALMNVQPLTGKDLLVLPEGERRIKRCKVICENRYDLRISDEEHGIWGDWIFYRGSWYKCEGADARDATPIGQTTAQFVLITGNYPGNLMEPPRISQEGDDDHK